LIGIDLRVVRGLMRGRVELGNGCRKQQQDQHYGPADEERDAQTRARRALGRFDAAAVRRVWDPRLRRLGGA
jgi:hypothetical protein